MSRHDLEQRTRVIFNLPLNNSRQEKVVKSVIAYLKRQQRKKIGVDGFTHSAIYPSVFSGYWFDQEKKDSQDEPWVEDRQVIFMVDYLHGGDRPLSLYQETSALKKAISELYAKHDEKEKEVWIVAHDLIRQA